MNSPVQMKLHSDEWKARKGKRRSGYHVDGEQNAEWVTRKVIPRDTHAKAKLALAIQKFHKQQKSKVELQDCPPRVQFSRSTAIALHFIHQPD
jgi:hypothetical protein